MPQSRAEFSRLAHQKQAENKLNSFGLRERNRDAAEEYEILMWLEESREEREMQDHEIRSLASSGWVLINEYGALGIGAPLSPCEQRRRKMNQRVVFDPWRT